MGEKKCIFINEEGAQMTGYHFTQPLNNNNKQDTTLSVKIGYTY